MAILTREQFIAALAPTVVRVRREGSILFPSVRLAQSILETGGVLHPWNNLGGIKVGSAQPNRYWQGEAVLKGTWEYVDGRNITARAAFRAYRSVYHFYKDQDLLLAAPRYLKVQQAQSPAQQAESLQASGYATDPAYASKLISIMKLYKLQRYDAAAMKVVQSPAKLKTAESVAVLYQDLYAADGYLQDGVTWAAARFLGERLGAVISWTGTEATINGLAVDTILSETTGYVKVRDLAITLGLKAEWDSSARAVLIV